MTTHHTPVSHSFDLSLPFLVVGVAIVVIGAVGMTVIDPIVTDDPSAIPVVATIGEGIDEFRVRVEKVVGPLVPTGFAGWLLTIAIFVTIWSVIKMIRDLHRPVRGAGDAGALVSHAIQRTAVAIGVRAPRVLWGAVRDVTTGHPLPLATVRLVGTDGAVHDSCVTDPFGRYGFRLSHASATERGYHMDLQTRKSGYYFRPASRGGVSKHTDGLDIFMDRAGDGAVPVQASDGRLWRASGVAAFWVSVATVPLAVTVASEPLSLFLIVGLASTTLGRLYGPEMHHQS